MKLLEEDQSKIISIIGENNGECIKFFKYIVSSCNSTPNNATTQSSSNKQSFNFTPSSSNAQTNQMNDYAAYHQNSQEKPGQFMQSETLIPQSNRMSGGSTGLQSF